MWNLAQIQQRRIWDVNYITITTSKWMSTSWRGLW